ncbi:hypothetical protein ACFE04_010354 [Oxalis oulophora]
MSICSNISPLLQRLHHHHHTSCCCSRVSKLKNYYYAAPPAHNLPRVSINCLNNNNITNLPTFSIACGTTHYLPFVVYDFFNDNERLVRLSSFNAFAYDHSAADSQTYSTNHPGPPEKSETSHRKSLTSNEMVQRLRRYGVAGILSYGLLNTAYYLTTFLVVWFYVVPPPGKMGYLAAAQRFLKMMAMVWAGSQVTKLIRAGGALALAPFVDRGLSWFTVKFKFESQGKAFMAIVGFCFGLAVLLFLGVTLLSA